MNSRSFYRILPYLACLIVCVAVDLFYFPATTVFPDEPRFLGEAARLVETGQFWIGPDRAWEMPGTALFFTPAVWLFGQHGAILAIRLTQAVLLVMQCALIAFIARRIFGKPTVAFIAACMAAVYPFFVFYQGLLLSETLFDTLLLASIAALYWWRERGMRIDIALVVTSVLFVAATMTKATLTVLPPLLLAATAFVAGVTWQRLRTIFVAALCLYVAFMSPWWIRNAMVLGSFVPLATSSAANLYLGNNRHNLEAGVDWARDAEPEVVARINALPSELERQRAFSKAALDYIKQNPMAFVRAAGKKFARFWNIVPNATEYKSALYSAISAASFGPVLLFALIGALRCWRQWRVLTPIYLIVGYFTFVYMVTVASLRYRLPIEGLLIILAAEPLTALLGLLCKRAPPGQAIGNALQP
jgi:4-amino-4-deoxy-L-arabinose transferase-like glycosyltransferase